MGVTKKRLENKRRTKEVSDRCNKVLEERFPDIPKKEIKVLYDPRILCSEIISNHDYSDAGIIYRTRARITVGEMFFEHSEEEQEAVLAHELGHYRRKKRSIGKHHVYIDRRKRWQAELDGLIKRRHAKKRLQTWYLMDELYADNQVINRGLGYPLLLSLRKFDEYYIALDMEEIETRIANLEKILGEEKCSQS